MSPLFPLLVFLFYQNLVVAYNEDAHLSVPELLKKYGYPCEVHHVTTSDGYILEMHRIPHGKTATNGARKPILVLHGILFSSDTFLVSGVDQALGYILADEGYDVWLGNVRGNIYCRNHTSLNPRSTKFWDFSWHEMGNFDLPAMIDYVLYITQKSELFYIAHSQGTTLVFVLLTMQPQYNEKITAHFSLAPVTFINHMNNFVFKLLTYLNGSNFLKLLGIKVLFPSTGSQLSQGSIIDKATGLLQSLFFSVLFDHKGVNSTVFKVLQGHFPAGTSLKQLLHYSQEIKSGYFRQYDHGLKNLKVYGSKVPPSYQLDLITSPGYLFYGSDDDVVAKVDVERLCEGMGGSCAGMYLVNGSFNHMDFIVGEDAPDLVYSKIVKLMNTFL